MRKVGLFLLAAVMVTGIAGCGDGIDRQPSREDISGAWTVALDGTWNGAQVYRKFQMTIIQDADGQVSGYVDGNPQCIGEVSGRLRDADMNSYSLTGQILSPLFINGTYYGCMDEDWSMSVVLLGKTFEGTASYSGNGKAVDGMTCRGDRRAW